MLLVTGLIIVVAYLVLSINTYLETQALGVFSLGYGRLGPTEARLGLVVVNTRWRSGSRPARSCSGNGHVLDLAGARPGGGWRALPVRAARNLRTLARRSRRNPAAHAAP